MAGGVILNPRHYLRRLRLRRSLVDPYELQPKTEKERWQVRRFVTLPAATIVCRCPAGLQPREDGRALWQVWL